VLKPGNQCRNTRLVQHSIGMDPTIERQCVILPWLTLSTTVSVHTQSITL